MLTPKVKKPRQLKRNADNSRSPTEVQATQQHSLRVQKAVCQGGSQERQPNSRGNRLERRGSAGSVGVVENSPKKRAPSIYPSGRTDVVDVGGVAGCGKSDLDRSGVVQEANQSGRDRRCGLHLDVNPLN